MRATRIPVASSSTRTTRLKNVLKTLLIAFFVTLFPLTSSAIMQMNQGAASGMRETSTAGLSTDELGTYYLQGKFRSFLGTPIAANHFITAKHVGISLSDTITFDQGPNAGSYAIVGWTDDPLTDLRIVEIAGTFNAWSQLWGTPDEISRTATLFGRGGSPNGQVWIASELKGWTAGNADGQISWGRNNIAGTYGPELLSTHFDTTGLSTEASLTVGDSGGGWFIVDAMGTIRLAAVAFAMTGPYQRDAAGVPNGAPFEAALFDLGGFWIGDPGSEFFVPNNPINYAAQSYGTRISNRIAWIGSVIALTSSDSDMDGIDNAFDNCPYTANPSQTDQGGIGTPTPDGIGNACQCGDVTGEGQVNSFDSEWIKRQALGLSAPLFLVPDNCDVTGEGICNGMDAILVRHAAAGNVSPFFGQNCPSAVP